MRSTVEPLEGNKVKLSVEVDEAEFEKAVDKAFKKLAREVRLPGFRPGKAPRKLLEARMGTGYARQEALREALPEYYAEAIKDGDVDAIAQPEIAITGGEESGPVTFDAIVPVRPLVGIEGYGGISVTLDAFDVTDADVDAQIDRLRGQMAELNDVERPVQTGDVVRIDLKATRQHDDHEDTLDDVEDYVYEVGSKSGFPDEVDANLLGAAIDEVKQFQATVPVKDEDDRVIDFVVTVKGVQEKILPEISDEWADEASEFDTVDALKDDLRTRLTASKRVQANIALRDGVLAQLTDLVTDDIPESLVNEETSRRINEMAQTLGRQNATIDQYLAATGQEPQAFVDELRTLSLPAVKADLALRALAEAEDIDATDDDIDEEIERLAPQFQRAAAQLRRELERADRISAVKMDVRKAKALEWLMDHAEVLDADGNAVDRALLTLPDEGDETDDSDGNEAVANENAEEAK